MATIDMRSLGEYIREQREAAEVSLRQLAKNSGVSNPYLSQVERGLKKPSAEILGQIAGALRISAETLYVRAGLLEPRAGSAAVTEAIAADDTISERQRQVLLEIYAAFQSENAAAAAAAEPDPAEDGSPDPAPKPTRAGTTTAGARRPTKEES
jgi:transcriptional regulator with XRE-family HTH domain